jgi:toxin HigB-1
MTMQVEFEDKSLAQLEVDPTFTYGLDQGIVRAFRKLLRFIRAALDERDFYAMKSLHYEKLGGKLAGKHSMRLNAQWRLILKIEKVDDGKLVVVVSIADYH